MTTRFAFAAGIGLLAACASPPPPQTAAITPVKAKASKAAADPTRQICRDQIVTGQLTSRKICHTQAEWDYLDKWNRETVLRSQEITRSANRQAGN